MVNVEETPFENREVVSALHVLDDNVNSYQILMYKTTGDIFQEDTVRCLGVPVGHPVLKMCQVEQHIYRTSLDLMLKKYTNFINAPFL